MFNPKEDQFIVDKNKELVHDSDVGEINIEACKVT